MKKRNKAIYVTQDSSRWLRVNFPFGLIAPPKIELHEPLVGNVEFYLAESWNLPIPDEAK